ncbi:hypothetical protein RF11_00856 [Thelohanellus kitauei]|uniref:Uncharacterized protein n=1 Tax=Thelohanellus kitauei TaxID=669202 RepID=A0A0C2II97_THEKT|nr:hypothetical protein RF11_00856 [Thelohanellus kitauei]
MRNPVLPVKKITTNAYPSYVNTMEASKMPLDKIEKMLTPIQKTRVTEHKTIDIPLSNITNTESKIGRFSPLIEHTEEQPKISEIEMQPPDNKPTMKLEINENLDPETLEKIG